MTKIFKHKTVLLNEAIESLNIRPDGIYIDCTFGCGGHSHLILSKLNKKGRLLAIDRDPQAVIFAKNINDVRFYFVNGLFSRIADYVYSCNFSRKIDGVLFDLGMSSIQLDNAERGFSFMHDGPLDMRMDPRYGQSVANWLNTSSKEDIAKIIKTFGEERFSKQIADAIMKYNRNKPITRTKELVDIISSINLIRNKHKHIATRTFQALRIFINNELQEIKLALQEAINLLNTNGRLSVISFHSLEDRIVKEFMLRHSLNTQIPSKLPITENQLRNLRAHKLKVLGKLVPNNEEITKNPRSRSAVLRYAKKI